MRPFFAEGIIETDDGEKLTLVCDFYAMDVIEQISGQNWDDILVALSDPPRALAAQVLYGLLRKRQEHVTLDEAAGLFFDKHSIAIWAIVGDVIRRACNIGGEEEEAPAKKKLGGRSKGSAGSG